MSEKRKSKGPPKAIKPRLKKFQSLKSKQIKEQLEKSDQWLKMLFERAPDAYYLTDLKGNLIDGNKTAEEMTGYKKEELIGRDFVNSGLLPPQETPKAAALLAKNSKGRSTGPDEFTLNRKDGSQVIVEIRTHPVKLGGRPLVLGMAHDITKRKEREKLLRIKNDAVTSSISAIAITDLEGNLTYVNDAFLEIWGYARDKELLGKAVMEFAESKSKALEILEEIRQRGSWTGEMIVVKKGGALLEVQVSASMVMDENNKPIAMIFSFADISLYKKAEIMLREREKAIRAILNATLDSIFLINTDAVVLEVNEEGAERLGRTREEVLGASIYDFFPPEVAKRRKKNIEEVVNSGQDSHFEDERQGRYFENSIYPISDEKGKVSSLAIYARDITGRKKAEEALRESEERYRLLAENITDTIWIVGMDMKLVFISPSVTRLLGYSVEEAMNKTMRETYTPASFELAMKALEDELINDKDRNPHRSRIVELELVRKDGSTVFIEGNFAFLRDENGQPSGILTVARDIAERKQVETESKKKIHDLEVFHKAAVDREFRIIELKNKIKELEKEIQEKS